MHGNYTSVFILLVVAATAFPQSGGGFNISQPTNASGGGVSAGGTFSLDSTIGQSVAKSAAGPGLLIDGGFWQPGFTPTAAGASLGGRVQTADGRGIVNASVSIMNTRTGETRWTRTGTFGAYKFAELAAGEVYILTVYSTKFSFTQPTRILSFNESVSGEDFIADDVGRRSARPETTRTN